MTERKPTGMSFRTWIDEQISSAAERGAFDNLPGAGKPLPKRDEADDGQAWLRDYLRREGVPADVLLPTPLKLRKESARLAETVPALRSEQDVREVVAELNHRIMEWRRIPIGPPIFVPLVDEEAMVASWRAGQPTGAPVAGSSGDQQVRETRPRPRWQRPRWRRRPRQTGR
jgi:hypothetical protein